MDPILDPTDPTDPTREPTLAQALALHLRAMRAKGCTQRSVDTLVEEQHRHLADWLERPLATLTRHEVATRHEHLTDTAGPYLANRVLQQFRAIHNTAARRFEHLPATNPTVAVTFNRLHRRRQPIPWPELPAWRAKVEALKNPVRRDLQLFLLLTGLRSLDARTIRREHLDLAAGTLHRPSPKGGERRAFTIPLSEPALALVQRRLAGNPALGHRVPAPGTPEADLHSADLPSAARTHPTPWLFPAHRRDGTPTHVQEPKQQRTVAGRKVAHLPSPHRLRDTFATAAHEAAIHPLDLKVLLNHALPATDDVTQGYIRPSLEHLRTATERIAAFLLERMGEGPGEHPENAD